MGLGYLVASFDGSKFIGDPKINDSLASLGFHFGAKVELKSRVTVIYGSGPADRHDVPKGYVTFVEGSEGADKLICKWKFTTYDTSESNKEEKEIRYAVAVKHFKLVKESATDDGAKSTDADAGMETHPAHVPGYPLIKVKEGEEVKVEKNWPDFVASKDNDLKVSNLKSSIGFGLLHTANALENTYKTSRFTGKDFTLVSRDGTWEVWTARDFDKLEIHLTAEGPTVMDVYWRQTRSVLVPESTQLHPLKKHVALDGRLRTAPSPTKFFSLFFTIRRSKDPKECNLVTGVATLSGSVKVNLPNTKTPYTFDVKEELCPIPLIFNNAPIKAGSQLIVLEDDELNKADLANKKIDEKLAKEKVAYSLQDDAPAFADLRQTHFLSSKAHSNNHVTQIPF